MTAGDPDFQRSRADTGSSSGPAPASVQPAADPRSVRRGWIARGRPGQGPTRSGPDPLRPRLAPPSPQLELPKACEEGRPRSPPQRAMGNSPRRGSVSPDLHPHGEEQYETGDQHRGSTEEPFRCGHPLEWVRQCSRWRGRVLCDEKCLRVRMLSRCRLEGPHLALPGRILCRIHGDLYQKWRVAWSRGEKVDFQGIAHAGPRYGVFAALQLQQHGRLNGTPSVFSTRPLVQRDQAGIDGIRFPRVHHTLPLRGAVHIEHSHQKGVLKVGEVLVEGVLPDPHPLGGSAMDAPRVILVRGTDTERLILSLGIRGCTLVLQPRVSPPVRPQGPWLSGASPASWRRSSASTTLSAAFPSQPRRTVPGPHP